MKITLLSILLLISIFSSGQTAKQMIEAHKCILPIDTTTGLITVEFTGKEDSVSAQELYSRFKIWAAKSFKSAQNVIQFDDPGVGQMIIKGNFDFYGNHGIPFNFISEFMIDARFKEGRYKVNISEIKIKANTIDANYFTPLIFAFHRWHGDVKIRESKWAKDSYILGLDMEKNWTVEMNNLIASLKLGLSQKSASEEDW